MESLYQDYLDALNEQKIANGRVLELQRQIYTKNQALYDEQNEGTVKVEEDGFKVKVVKRMSVAVDQEKAAKQKKLFTCKYGFSKELYKTASDEEKTLIDQCLTRKPAKPSFSVEAL